MIKQIKSLFAGRFRVDQLLTANIVRAKEWIFGLGATIKHTAGMRLLSGYHTVRRLIGDW